MNGTTANDLEVLNLTKNYWLTRALDEINFKLEPGVILGIAGPNGAGKSTLIKIIAGEVFADSGSILLGGQQLEPARSVAVVHQETDLFPNLTVADNMMVGREGGGFRRPALDEDAKLHLQRFGIIDRTNQIVGSCSLAVQQQVEIARALAREAQIFLFDEPNSALREEESVQLFREMRRLADEGRHVILVTHRFHDLADNCDRVFIVRNGKITDTLSGKHLTEDEIARRMVMEHQRSSERAVRDTGSNGAQVVLSAKDWTSTRGRFSDVSLDLKRGDVVALMGAEGSGAREFLRSIAGLEDAEGQLTIDCGDAEENRLSTAYVPATRQLSLFPNLNVGQNIIVRKGRDVAGVAGQLKQRKITGIVEKAVTNFSIKVANASQPIRALSGGNQQKVAIASAIVSGPQVLILEEPTRGVDITSREDIYDLVRDYASSGAAVLMYCTEVPEVYEAADYVYVMKAGTLLDPVGTQESTVAELAAKVAVLEGTGHLEMADVQTAVSDGSIDRQEEDE